MSGAGIPAAVAAAPPERPALAARPPLRTGYLRPIGSLLEREMIRFVRQRSRVFGALGQPVLFWLLLGSGLGGSFVPLGSPAGTTYLTWFFPGTLVLVVLFTSVFSTISIIEDRRAGFLQGVLVAPIPRFAIVLGKVFGGSLLALGQAVLLLPAAAVIGPRLGVAAVLLAVLGIGAIAVMLTSIGFCIAWRMETTQGFHMVMNIFLMPMWLLSGAFFPVAGTPGWLRLAMEINPLTYGVAAVRRALAWGGPDPGAAVPSLALSLAIALLVSALSLGIAVAQVRAPGDGRR
jgi:ABC-2 type transport system permease protein